MRGWLAGWLLVWTAACGGAPAPAPASATETRETRIEELRVADGFEGRTFVVLETLDRDEAVGDELEGVGEDTLPRISPREGEIPAPTFTLYGEQGACLGRATRLVTLEAFERVSDRGDGVVRAGRVRFVAVEVEADCPAWLALPGPPREDVRFDPVRWREPTDEELEEDLGELSGLERGRFGAHADAIQRVGPIPEGDVCPEFVTYEVVPDDGAPPMTLSLPHEELLGLLRVGALAVGVADLYHRLLVAPDPRSDPAIQLRVPSRTNMDIEASPCL